MLLSSFTGALLSAFCCVLVQLHFDDFRCFCRFAPCKSGASTIRHWCCSRLAVGKDNKSKFFVFSFWWGSHENEWLNGQPERYPWQCRKKLWAHLLRCPRSFITLWAQHCKKGSSESSRDGKWRASDRHSKYPRAETSAVVVQPLPASHWHTDWCYLPVPAMQPLSK